MIHFVGIYPFRTPSLQVEIFGGLSYYIHDDMMKKSPKKHPKKTDKIQKKDFFNLLKKAVKPAIKG